MKNHQIAVRVYLTEVDHLGIPMVNTRITQDFKLSPGLPEETVIDIAKTNLEYIIKNLNKVINET